MKANLAKLISLRRTRVRIPPHTPPLQKDTTEKPKAPASGRRRKPVGQRLEERLRVLPSGCWEWTGYRDRNRYGWIKVDGRKVPVHRAAFEVFIGPIPDWADDLDHTCGNRWCINPATG